MCRRRSPCGNHPTPLCSSARCCSHRLHLRTHGDSRRQLAGMPCCSATQHFHKTETKQHELRERRRNSPWRRTFSSASAARPLVNYEIRSKSGMLYYARTLLCSRRIARAVTTIGIIVVDVMMKSATTTATRKAVSSSTSARFFVVRFLQTNTKW